MVSIAFKDYCDTWVKFTKYNVGAILTKNIKIKIMLVPFRLIKDFELVL